jgi:ABC-2 type transport system ATP-binding protein
MTLTESKEGQLVIALDPSVLQVSDGIAHLTKQTELVDISVSDITAEEMVATLYKEYRI